MSDLLQGEADYGLKTTVLKTKSNDENAKSGRRHTQQRSTTEAATASNHGECKVQIISQH